MRIVSAARLCLRRCALSLIFAVAVCWSPAAATTDIVLLVDVSTSMRDVFPEVQRRMRDEVANSEIGDRISVVAFGSRANLVDRRTIRNDGDRRELHALIDSLRPTQRSTYLLQGVDRAFLELRYLFDAHPGRERRLVWLSDEKNNPPESLGDDILTLDDLRDLHEPMGAQGEWFETETPLTSGGENEAREFLAWARLSHHLLRVRDTAVDLGEQDWPNTRLTANVRLHPPANVIAGLPLAVSIRVRNPADPGGQPITLASDPDEIAIRAEPWTQRFDIAYDGPEGLVEGYIVFDALDDGYAVEPRRIPFSFTAGRSAERSAVGGWSELPRLAESNVRLWRLGGDANAREPVELGPVEPGKSYTQRLRVQTTGITTPDQLSVSANISLPTGFYLSAGVAGQGKDFAIDLRLDVVDQAVLPDFSLLGGDIEGSILVRTPDPNLGVRPAIRPIRITIESDRTGWGRPRLAVIRPEDEAELAERSTEELATSSPSADEAAPEMVVAQAAADDQTTVALETSATPPTEEVAVSDDRGRTEETVQLASGTEPRPDLPVPAGTSPSVNPVWALVAFGAVAGCSAGAWLWRKRPRKLALRAELRAVRLPDAVRRVEMLDLGRLLSGRGGKDLSIGSGKNSDLQLAHESVLPAHARLSAVPTHESTTILLHTVPGADVRVNDELRVGRSRLRQNDVITLGDCIFLFTTAEPEVHAVVHFLDGRVEHGVPEDWDLMGDKIDVILDHPTTELDTMTVWFQQLKGLFIAIEGGTHHAPDPADPRFAKNMEVTVVFADGEVLTGYVLKDYSPLEDRFYLFPRESSSTICVLVERANARGVRERSY